MPDEAEAGQVTEPRPEPQPRSEPDWQRKRRLAEVFGDVLPETTADERDPAEGSGGSEKSGDTWLKEQVPPHHG